MDRTEHQEQPPSLPSQQRLIGDLRQVIENAEELMKSTHQYSGGIHHSVRARLAQALEVANQELERIEEAQLTRMIAATHEANIRCNDSGGEAKVLRAFH